MADLSDVEDALTARIVQIVYPGGISVAGLGGKTIKVYRGWPSPIGLNADLAANVSTISVFSDPKTTRDTTRYPRVWRDQGISRPSISLSCIGTSIFVGGSAGAPQVAGLEIDGTAFCVAVKSTDTPAIVATSLAALIPGAVRGRGRSSRSEARRPSWPGPPAAASRRWRPDARNSWS